MDHQPYRAPGSKANPRLATWHGDTAIAGYDVVMLTDLAKILSHATTSHTAVPCAWLSAADGNNGNNNDDNTTRTLRGARRFTYTCAAKNNTTAYTATAVLCSVRQQSL